MNKAELIDALTEKLGTDRRQATAAVEHIVDTIDRAEAWDIDDEVDWGVVEALISGARQG